jgi:hypothetical protein
VIILKAYLAAQPVGTTTLTFKFSGGADQTLVIAITDSTPSAPPGGGGGTGTTDTQTTITTTGGTTIVTTTVASTTDANGIAAATVTQNQVSEAVNRLLNEPGTGNTDSEIEINISGTSGTTGISVTIPQSSMALLTDSAIDTLTIKSAAVTVSFDDTALAAIGGAGSGDVTITAMTVNADNLTDEYRQLVGSRPVYDLSVSAGNTAVSNFGGGTATVSIPYAPGPNEDINKIVVFYVADSGELIMVPNCVFDPVTGTVTFTTTHFSMYAVGYKDICFSDVAGWYKDDVYYLLARDIMKGPGEGLFAPAGTITRAELAQVLYNLSGAPAAASQISPFSDVRTTDWFYEAVQWAYDSGIITGYDGKFDPNAPVKRQDMAVMIVRYVDKAMKHPLPVGGQTVSFTDSEDISDYAQNAVLAMQSAGIVSGSSDGSFKPQAYTTRAEAAKIIAGLLKTIIN